MSSKYEATGTLIEIFDTMQVSEKFSKREAILETKDGQYAEQVKFEFTQDKTSLLDGFAVGQEATISFNLRGKGYNKNGQMLYFTSLAAWKIEAAGTTQASAPKSDFASANKNPALRQQAAPIASNDDNDLPF